MITEIALNYLRNLFGISKIESHAGKGRVKKSTPHITQFTALACRLCVFRVQACQRSERCFTRIYTLGKTAELVLYTVNLGLLNLRSLNQNLHFYLCWHKRNTVL